MKTPNCWFCGKKLRGRGGANDFKGMLCLDLEVPLLAYRCDNCERTYLTYGVFEE